MTSADLESLGTLTCGDTVLDAGTFTLRGAETECALTATEFRLMHILFRQPNLLLHRDALMNAMFAQRKNPPEEPILRVYMHRIRNRLRQTGSNLTIATRHGMGWILVAPVEVAAPARASNVGGFWS